MAIYFILYIGFTNYLQYTTVELIASYPQNPAEIVFRRMMTVLALEFITNSWMNSRVKRPEWSKFLSFP